MNDNDSTSVIVSSSSNNDLPSCLYSVVENGDILIQMNNMDIFPLPSVIFEVNETEKIHDMVTKEKTKLQEILKQKVMELDALKEDIQKLLQ